MHSHLRCLLVFAALTFVQAATTATLSGRVADEDGVPISGVAMVWRSLPSGQNSGVMALTPNQQSIAGTRGSVISDAAGQFSVPNLEPGNYEVCLTSIAQRSHLSTCEWRANAVLVVLSDSSPETQFVVKTGTVMRFLVSDPKARLTKNNLSIIVSDGTGNFAHARMASLTPSAAELFVSVPFNSQIAISINAPFSFLNGTGASVAPNLPTTISIGNRAEQDISFVAK